MALTKECKRCGERKVLADSLEVFCCDRKRTMVTKAQSKSIVTTRNNQKNFDRESIDIKLGKKGWD